MKQKTFLPPDGFVKDQWMRAPLVAGVMRPRFWQTQHWLRVNPHNALCAALLVPRSKRHTVLDDAGAKLKDREARLFLGPAFGIKGSREAYYDPRLVSCESPLRRRGESWEA